MTATVERLIHEALLLSSDSRTELVEAILEGSAPSSEFIEQQMAVVQERIDNVRNGRSDLIRDEDAHRHVRDFTADCEQSLPSSINPVNNAG